MDVKAVEKVGLDTLIERRTREHSKANELAAMWRRSEEAYREKRRRENRARWHAFHLDQAERIERTAAELVAQHRAKASLLEEPGGGA